MMRKEILRGSFAYYSSYVDAENSILIQTWKNNEKAMQNIDYQEEMQNYLMLVEREQAEKALIDLKEFYFTIPIELQEWVDENIASKANKIVRKIAFIMPEDMIEELSVKLTMEEDEGGNYEGVAYFGEEDKALHWLLG